MRKAPADRAPASDHRRRDRVDHETVADRDDRVSGIVLGWGHRPRRGRAGPCTNRALDIVPGVRYASAVVVPEGEAEVKELIERLQWLRLVHGEYGEQQLRSLAEQHRIPLYRIQELISYYPQLRPRPAGVRLLRVCRDVVCALHGCEELRQQLAAQLREAAVDDTVIESCSCLGRCDTAPAALLDDEPVRLTSRLGHVVPAPVPVPEPSDNRPDWQLYPYPNRARAYSTLAELRAAETEEAAGRILAALERAELRGMGGAGFPTHRKWRAVAAAAGSPKYVICNADESEPGTFKDRMILATMPELVLEGMVLAALATGARHGYIFIRHEYGPEAAVVEEAIERARARGWLGPAAIGPGRPFDVELVRSPGGYILGEETALLEVLEGRRGEPRLRPPYPAESGLYGKPTLINNVETFAAAAAIVARGAEWWRSFGQNGACGLKLVSVCGDVAHPGVYEVELGTPIRAIIELAGGVRDGRPLKAFTAGGVSATWLGPEHVDTPLSFESLRAAGSSLGTGAIIVLADDRSAVATARSIVEFFAAESCGKCVPCRLGTALAARQLRATLEDPSCSGLDLAFLRQLADTLRETSICGLGQVALSGLLSLVERFPEEFPLRSSADNADPEGKRAR